MLLPRTRDWLRSLGALLLALSLVLAPVSAFADEDDDLFADEPEEEEFQDDFLQDDYVEQEEEEARGLRYWAFDVPVDLLLTRPYALTDTVIGGGFFVASVPLIALFMGGQSSWEFIRGEGWYFDSGGIQAARQICVDDPWAYAWDRPLGKLSSEY